MKMGIPIYMMSKGIVLKVITLKIIKLYLGRNPRY